MGESRSTRTSTPFVFKQFELIQGDSSWKVGTDSILLGSWCNVEHADTALDLGTGSGILSLMLAQRSARLKINAVEIAKEAVVEAGINIQNSPWADRIRVIECDIALDKEELRSGYDLIICNPPYFPFGQHSGNAIRKRSRQGSGFSLWDVPKISRSFLNTSGKLNVVLPVPSVYGFITKANVYGLYVHRKLTIKHNTHAQASLALLELGMEIIPPENRTLNLYSVNKPTPEYITLCGEFINI